jgi:hypothetical protein
VYTRDIFNRDWLFLYIIKMGLWNEKSIDYSIKLYGFEYFK